MTPRRTIALCHPPGCFISG